MSHVRFSVKIIGSKRWVHVADVSRLLLLQRGKVVLIKNEEVYIRSKMTLVRIFVSR
jgi:hypothetical protein